MEISRLTKHTDLKVFNQLASLHKKSLKNTIASTLSDNRLSKVYLYMVKEEILQIIVATSESNIIGSLSFREHPKDTSLRNLIFLIYISLIGFISHPIVWIVELYFKIGLYRNIKSNVNIVTLFVDLNYQNKKIGQALINFVINEYKNPITVDTRSNNNSAINFYKKNKFEIVNSNKKNTVLNRG